jgi:dTDP-4-amino-4,6-dideoxy-D-glucose acyltransferase
MDRFLSATELSALGLASLGNRVSIDRSAVIINPAHLTIGSRVRIDAFALLIAGPAGLAIGSNVHIGASTQVFGNSGQVVIEDFAGISPRACLFTATDDFVEGHLTGPTVPLQFRRPTTGSIILKRHAVVGAGSIVLPNVVVGWGATIGALSLVQKPVPDLFVMFGCPARKVGTRRQDVLERLERQYLEELRSDAGLEGRGNND